jgi:DDE superfamily endonuclease
MRWAATPRSGPLVYAYSPRGKRAFFKIPRNRGKNTTLLASISCEGGMDPSMATLRDPRPERSSRPRLGVLSSCQAETVGQVVLMDNLGAHKGQRVRELIEGRGCELLYLPPYYSSPDFNQIVQSDCEEAFSKIKGFCALDWCPDKRGAGGGHRQGTRYGHC